MGLNDVDVRAAYKQALENRQHMAYRVEEASRAQQLALDAYEHSLIAVRRLAKHALRTLRVRFDLAPGEQREQLAVLVQSTSGVLVNRAQDLRLDIDTLSAALLDRLVTERARDRARAEVDRLKGLLPKEEDDDGLPL